MNIAEFHCKFCYDLPSFTRKSSLYRHIASKHRSSAEHFECSQCGKRYTRKDNLKIHIAKHQPDQPVFECAHCSKNFRYKCNLVQHIDTAHRPFFDKLNENDSKPNEILHRFECFHCSSTFSRKNNLRRHIEKCPLVQNERKKESHLTCLKCSNVFWSTKTLNNHYVQVHGIRLTYQHLEFDSVRSYEQWLENQQHETLTQFVIWYRKKSTSHSTQRLICHRSRYSRSTLKAEDRKRCLKTNGYKHLGGICPAEIRLQIRQDGKCYVKYQSTHVGHNIGDKSELGLTFTSKAEKRKIADKIQVGIPLVQIVNGERLSAFSHENVSRLSLVNRRDVRNIAVSKKLDLADRQQAQSRCDSDDVEAIITAHSNDILFYKRRTEEDSRFDLEKEDTALVIMTSNQETYLRTYGYKVVCLHCTRGMCSRGFSLYTLLVLDVDCESLPAAFLITNRNDQLIIDVFLACVRDRVGILEPRTLVTDTQTKYYDSWARIMKAPQYFIFCAWYVQEAWRKNFMKITNKKKRNDTRAELTRLRHELDPIKFENGLNSFLTRKDDDLTDFQHHFRENYGSNAQQWAYCYRTMAGVNTNMNFESFHKSLRLSLVDGQKIQSVTHFLAFIFKYLTLLEVNIFEKKVRGKITSKLGILRSRHRAALEQYRKNALSSVVSIDDNAFIVHSFEHTDISYTVSKYKLTECALDGDSTCCRLVCDGCEFCFHAYNCTCEDSSVKSNMCEHIHLVGLYLRDRRSESDADMLHERYKYVETFVEDDQIFKSELSDSENCEYYEVEDDDVLEKKYGQLMAETIQITTIV